MLIPELFLIAFKGFDESCYLDFTISCSKFFINIEESKKAQAEDAFYLLQTLSDWIDYCNKEACDEQREFEKDILELLNRNKLCEAIKVIVETLTEVWEQQNFDSKEFEEDERIPEEVYENILDYLKQFESCFYLVDKITAPQFKRYWKPEEVSDFNDHALITFKKEEFPEYLKDNLSGEGVNAEFDRDSNLISIRGYQHGDTKNAYRELLLDYKNRKLKVIDTKEFEDPQKDLNGAIRYHDLCNKEIRNLSEYIKEEKVPGTYVLYCDFCGASQNEVKKLIAGPSIYICNNCVDLCNDILADDWQDKE